MSTFRAKTWIMTRVRIQTAAKLLHKGQVGVGPTDTLYGLLAKAGSRAAVERLYEIKKRRPMKPFIILINDLDQLSHFDCYPTEEELAVLRRYWPGPSSFILPVKDSNDLDYLTRGTGKLAFRHPNRQQLLELIDLTGPLVAPSANPEGLEPAQTVIEAETYFGDRVDFYVDDGLLPGPASELFELIGNDLKQLR